ncbi:MAG: hypothetical protein ACYC1K_03255 [Minisyncoccota bacterium]
MDPKATVAPESTVEPVSVTPTTGAVETPADDTSSDINWGELSTESEVPEEELSSSESVDPVAVPPAKAPAGAAVAPPVVPPVQTPAAVQPVAPTTAPVQPPSTPAAAPPATPASPETPVDFAKQRESFLTELEQSYAMTEDEGLELLKSPETVLPKLAAQLQLNVMEQVIQQVASMLPQFMDSHVGQQKASADNRKSFFEAWPDLNKPEYEETLTRVALAYRQANPTASKEKTIKEIGAIAAITLGVVPNAQATPPVNPPVQPAYRPTMPGGGGRAAVVPVTNEFTQLANEWGDE